MSTINITSIQSTVLQLHQLHEQLSLAEVQMINSAIVSMLTKSSCQNGETLKYLARLLSPTSYMDIINARTENKLCGYPLCHKRVMEDLVTGIFKHPMYCSRFHSKCSLYLMGQLPQTSLHERLGVHLISYNIFNSNNEYTVDLLEEVVGNGLSIDAIKSLIVSFKVLGFDDVCEDESLLLDKYFEQLFSEEQNSWNIR
ncbi:hypothetical protein SMKI_04G2880 [Saccharomyces mikatae IFO 1815]|uniref:RNA polymerase II subunit B1 CTD phosphatase RPAP2 homolog n=1 Tax=Saccharomyces mikatae IFO 1815 TaxID=226126 RepID=A0AA35NGS8_SACMI|nr:uncharacterized protein SMKI_04G2880 [Saccharomyces mikatae IFO 1815]CAI4037951.1 hypothetical protein SMKI_04G2880 [Saccharomyces mikatae IFO 1815]